MRENRVLRKPIFISLVALSLLFSGCDEAKDDRKLSGNSLTYYGPTLTKHFITMVVGGTAIDDVRFNTPDELQYLDDEKIGLFHPKGGRAKYMIPYKNSHPNARWYFNADLIIPGLEKYEKSFSNQASPEKSDIVGFLVGVDENICKDTNQRLDYVDASPINGIPKLKYDQSSYYTKQLKYFGEQQDYQYPTSSPPTIANEDFYGKPFGCFESFEGDQFVYYQVLIYR